MMALGAMTFVAKTHIIITFGITIRLKTLNLMTFRTWYSE